MPKASSSVTSLKRNQACKQCRKRKLKCDAQRPHCGTCVRTWTTQCAVPPPVGYAHPTEPTCIYDPVEGLRPVSRPTPDPADRVRILEDEISELKEKLHEAQFELQQPPLVQQLEGASPSVNTVNSMLPPPGNPSPSHVIHSPPQHRSDSILYPTVPVDNPSRMKDTNAESYASHSESLAFTLGPDPFMKLLFSGWNPELPEPAILLRLVDIYFRCDPCASARILHRPSFMASLSLPPSHSDFPHPAILHAICASASRWTSAEGSNIAPDGSRRDRFAEFHAAKTRSFINQTIASGANIFSVLQATNILSWYLYMEGKWVEIWIFSGFQTRVAVPLRLNYPGTHPKLSGSTQLGYLQPPKNLRELELRRRTWWMCLVLDRLVSVGGWLHGIDERDIGTELPLRSVDFENEHVMENNPQNFSDESTLVVHPSDYTDSFLLLIKACMLFGKITDYTVRMNLHGHPSKHTGDVRSSPTFQALDRLVTVDFLASLPQKYKDCLGINDFFGISNIDTDLYLVHLIPHAAIITLHNPFMNLSSATDPSAARCLDAARAILNAYYLITSTSFSIKRLHPFTVICWYLAAVVQVHLCKRLIELGDRSNEAIVWGEINVLRMAMLEYGTWSPIGIYQEKLLQGLMSEILQMTSQAQPLKVGVPLYPFSHAVFPIQSGNVPDFKDMAAGASIAPLLGTSFSDLSLATNGDPPPAPAGVLIP